MGTYWVRIFSFLPFADTISLAPWAIFFYRCGYISSSWTVKNGRRSHVAIGQRIVFRDNLVAHPLRCETKSFEIEREHTVDSGQTRSNRQRWRFFVFCAFSTRPRVSFSFLVVGRIADWNRTERVLLHGWKFFGSKSIVETNRVSAKSPKSGAAQEEWKNGWRFT